MDGTKNLRYFELRINVARCAGLSVAPFSKCSMFPTFILFLQLNTNALIICVGIELAYSGKAKAYLCFIMLKRKENATFQDVQREIIIARAKNVYLLSFRVEIILKEWVEIALKKNFLFFFFFFSLPFPPDKFFFSFCF